MMQRFFVILAYSMWLTACSVGSTPSEAPELDAWIGDVMESWEPDTLDRPGLTPDNGAAGEFDSSSADDARIPDVHGHDVPGHHPVDAESEPMPPGSIAGRVVNEAGEGLGGIKMLACTVNLCVSSETDDFGEYYFEQISAEPQKMQATDTTGEYMAVLFYQECVSGSFSSLSKEVVLPSRDSAELTWPEERAGTMLLADGALEIVVDAESLEYPLGYFDQKLVAESVSGTLLPPFNQLPWKGMEEMVRAFYLFPLHIMAEPPARLRAQIEGAKEGEIYEIWSVNPDTAKLKLVGEGVADGDSWVSEPKPTGVEHLSILVFSPKS